MANFIVMEIKKYFILVKITCYFLMKVKKIQLDSNNWIKKIMDGY